MLITKFRNKFNINLSTELPLDAKMVDHINQCTKSNDILGEKALVQMQKHLQAMVNEYRRKESASEMKPRVAKPEEKPVADLRKSMPEPSKPAFATETHNKA